MSVRYLLQGARKWWTVSTVALVVAAAATAVTVHLVRDDDSRRTAPIDTTALAARLLHPYQCPAAGSQAGRVSVPKLDEVPAGAVLARTCPALGSGLLSWSAPLDALTTGVRTVIDAYNGLPKGLALPCAAPIGRQVAFNVTFQYADGRLVRVSAGSNGTGGCDLISIDGRDELGRADAGTVMTAFFNELLRQRSSTTPPRSVSRATPACPSSPRGVVPGLLPARTVLEMKTGIICEYALLPATLTRSGVLSASELATVDREYAAHVTKSSAGQTCMAPLPPTDVIVGQTAWGDTAALSGACSTYLRLGDESDGQLFWTPSPPVALMLDSALRSQR